MGKILDIVDNSIVLSKDIYSGLRIVRLEHKCKECGQDYIPKVDHAVEAEKIRNFLRSSISSNIYGNLKNLLARLG